MDVRLINISKQRVATVDPNAPLVSICDPNGLPPHIPNRENRPLLFLEFYPGDHAMPEDRPNQLFTTSKARKFIDFINAQKEAGAEAIYIQCGEGRIRSWTLAEQAHCELEGFDHDTENASIKSGIIDRYTRRIFADAVREIESGQNAVS